MGESDQVNIYSVYNLGRTFSIGRRSDERPSEPNVAAAGYEFLVDLSTEPRQDQISGSVFRLIISFEVSFETQHLDSMPRRRLPFRRRPRPAARARTGADLGSNQYMILSPQSRCKWRSYLVPPCRVLLSI